MKIKEATGDRIFGTIVTTIVVICVILCAYPVYLVIINSFSDPALVAAGKVFLLPQGFTLDAYKVTFENGMSCVVMPIRLLIHLWASVSTCC